jgi:hypothetical protein
MGEQIRGVLSLVFSVILITEVLIPTYKNANTTSWSTAEKTIFGLSSLAAIAGLVYGTLAVFGIG